MNVCARLASRAVPMRLGVSGASFTARAPAIRSLGIQNIRLLCTEPTEKRFKIYTRTGDKGTSSLFSGERVPKDDHVFEALGATDELTSAIGLAREFSIDASNGLDDKLESIQCVLQEIASCIATPRTRASAAHIEKTRFNDGFVDLLEMWIDEMDTALPPLRNFILPSGGKSGAALHVARTICRRAERRAVPLVRTGDLEEEAGRYLNRLSDYLFAAARYAAQREGKEVVAYKANHGKILLTKKKPSS